MITKERLGTELELITNRIRHGIENGKYSWTEVQGQLKEKSTRAARQTDYYVHDNAWKAIGISAAIAFVGGLLLKGNTAPKIKVQPTKRLVVDEHGKPVHTAGKLASWELLHSVLPLALFLWRAAQSTRCAKRGEPDIL